MKQVLLFVAAVLLSLGLPGYAADSYYYLYGEQRQLTVMPGKITIIPSMPLFDDWEGLYADYGELDAGLPAQAVPGAGAWLLYVRSGSDIDGLLTRLRLDMRVAVAGPVYGDQAGRDIYVGRRLYVKFPSARTASIDSLLTASGLRRIRDVFHDNTALLVELRD